MALTDNEIIKALDCCIQETSDCGNCPLYVPADADCINISKAGALDLINRQKAEIERLQKQLNNAEDLVCEKTCKITDLNGDIEILQKQFDELSRVARGLHEENVSQKAEIERLKEFGSYWRDNGLKERAEAIKEFAERLKEKVCEPPVYNGMKDKLVGEKVIFLSDLDNLVKEKAGDDKE